MRRQIHRQILKMEGRMRTIMMTYPGFQTLPRGVKKMLVASENFFFTEAEPQPLDRRETSHRIGDLPQVRNVALESYWRN